MTVFINNRELQLFKGARVGDAILAYSEFSNKRVISGQYIVLDRFGNITELDGPISEGQQLNIVKKKRL